MSRRARPHRLAELMANLRLSDRQLAELVEPRPDQRESMRGRIVKYRHGQMMTDATAERFAAGLSRAAGRPVTVDDLLLNEAARPASPEALVLLEERVGEVEVQLRALVVEVREIRVFLQPPAAAPRSLPLPHQPRAEDC